MEDVTPPALLNLSVSPASVDTTGGPATVTVTARITDDLSGLNYAAAQYRSPSGQQSATAYLFPPPLSGTINDGVFQANLPFPQYCEAGTWTLSLVYMVDRVGNWVQVFTPQLEAMGLPTQLVVASIADTDPPSLGTLSFSPAAVDTAGGPATVTVAAQIDDGLSGLNYAVAQFRSPSGQQSATAYLFPPPLSGTIQSGVFQSNLVLPQNCETGTWTLALVYMVDRVGNWIQLFTPELSSRGIRTELVVSSAADTAPPVLIDLNSSPAAIDTSETSVAVTVTATIADDIAGLNYAAAQYRSPSGQQSATAYLFPPPQSGTINDGVFQANALFPHHCEEGTWNLALVYMVDRVGNWVQVFTPELAAMGFPTTVVVGTQTIHVSIDIKPGGGVNSINPASHGTIPVAILSTASFEAASVDGSSLTFGRTGSENSLSRCNASLEDVNGDGRPDQVCHFSTPATGFRSGDIQGILKGKTRSGAPIRGTDSIRIVP